jgi:hypothetical protein
LTKEAIARDGVQDRDITRGQLKGRRFFCATKARPAKGLWTL